VKFVGEVRDQAKADLYARASLFVLPSLDENYGIVVGEALAAGLPVVTTTATPWRHVPDIGAGWVTEPRASALAATLRQALAVEEPVLREMGERAQDWARRHLGWEDVATKMHAYYEWLLGQVRPKPTFVR
jgi:glycosyltransferase involved in cell wall biosynthesis